MTTIVIGKIVGVVGVVGMVGVVGATGVTGAIDVVGVTGVAGLVAVGGAPVLLPVWVLSSPPPPHAERAEISRAQAMRWN